MNWLEVVFTVNLSKSMVLRAVEADLFVVETPFILELLFFCLPLFLTLAVEGLALKLALHSS